jgi:hypothetical protein
VIGDRRSPSAAPAPGTSPPVIPGCWPQHPHLVHEIAVLADQRRRAGTARTSDVLEEWHRTPCRYSSTGCALGTRTAARKATRVTCPYLLRAHQRPSQSRTDVYGRYVQTAIRPAGASPGRPRLGVVILENVTKTACPAPGSPRD